LAASQTSGSEKQEDSSVAQVPGNSVIDFLSQSLHDISSASLPASHNVSLFDDSQLMPELAKLADGVSFSEMGMGDHQQIDPSIQVDGSLSIGEDTKLFHTPTPLEGIPSQTPPTPDSPKHKSDKSSLGDLCDLTVWKDSQLTYFLESSNLSTDQLTEISPDLAEEESILQRIVQGQEDEVETFLMSQTVWDEEEDCLPVPQNHEMPTRSSLPQLDGSNSESNKKTKPSSSKKRMKLGSTRRFKPMKSTGVATSLFPDPHSVPVCDKEHCLVQKEEVGEEEHTAPLLTSRKRLPSTQDQKDHDCEFEPVTVDQDRVNPSDVPGHDLEEKLEVPHSKLLWNLLNSTVKVAKERKDEIKNVLDCIDKSYHEEEQEASEFECSPVKRSSANTECGESPSVDATNSWKSSSPLCEVVCIAPVLSPPSMKELLADDERMHVCQHQEAFYSNLQDRQEPMRVGNHILQISLNLASEYKEFKPNCLDYSPCLNLAESGINHWDVVFNAVFPSVTDRPEVLAGVSVLTPACPPPSYKCLKSISTSNTKSFLKKKNSSPSTPPSNDTVVIDGPTPANSFGFKLTPTTYCSEDSQIYGEENLNLLAMSVELHVRTCKGKRPNPETDPILCIFYYIHGTSGSTSDPALPKLGIISAEDLTRCSTEDINVVHVSSEKDLVVSICQLVCTYNPDILVGFEVQQLSWGYLNERAAFLDINLCQQLSRTPEHKMDDSNKQASIAKQSTDMYVVGRCIINLWRLVRHEITLNIYTFENVAYHVLHQRLPHFSFETLTKWFDSTHPHLRWQVVDYYLRRCTANFEIIEKFNLIGRTSEFAKLYGILFSEVLSRGSQFRVESILLRLAHAKGFVGVSPGIQQRARMAAPECLPLILEPESRFYTDPVVVLDFQSLYPSIIIGHNYCFSTCLGRVQHVRSMSEEYKFGATSMFLPSNVLKLINDDQVTISPNGVVFVKSATRKGLIPEMLQEILDTRVMVKKSMKMHKDNKKLEKILDARQMGLKLIANVTYGYTGAHFSGRMPCVEVADSIVAKARETLDRAIRLVNSTKKWNAKVVYGDTDSMFVLLKGASKDQAFKIGQEIVSEVTAMNPKPVKLKFEKVYLPCVLQTKKRYVGFMYESEDQSEPVFDAKGIETVRRDNCPAVSKILEKSIKLLFSTKDVSNCKVYIQSQLRKLLEGRVALSDYTFAKEYRGESSYRPGACVPALSLARQAMLLDKRAEPRVGERVPYVVVCGTPGLPLFKLIRRPEDFLANPGFRLNATYYASKQILPALNRVFSLLGANVFNWYKEISIVSRVNAPSTNPKLKGTLGDYFASMHCPICGRLTGDDVCESCKRDNQALVVKSLAILRNSEKRLSELNTICQVCCSNADVAVTQECSALFCPVFNKRTSSLRCAQTASLRLKDVINKQEQW
jgi:DNA polymerase zeta